jgi:hypothetical protein
MHDPDGILFPHLKDATPFLRQAFARGYVNLTAVTIERQPEWCAWLRSQSLFRITVCDDTHVGGQFAQLYRDAAAACPPNQVLHLGFVDRVAYALGSELREPFLVDVLAIRAGDTPLLYQRSAAAWETHPANYRMMEAMVTAAGAALLGGRVFDFAWCYLAITAGRLRSLMPGVTRPDLSMLAEMVLGLRDELRVREADWLAWEDPFILGREADALKREREGSPDEVRKRLGYVIPMLQVLADDGRDA